MLLAIESSSRVCSIALFEGEDVVCEYSIYLPNQHDRMLAELVKRAMHDFRVDSKNIDFIALSAGPGSFTALRIGASLAKALCFNSETKLIAVPTLEAIAFNFFAENSSFVENIVACSHSHQRFYYYQIFGKSLRKLSEIYFDVFENVIKQGLLVCGNIVEQFLGGNIRQIPLTAKMIGNYARLFIEKQNFVDPLEFTPLYIQEFIPKSFRR